MDYDISEKEKRRMEKAANFPWAENVGQFEMTEEEKENAKEDLLRLIEKFGKE